MNILSAIEIILLGARSLVHNHNRGDGVYSSCQKSQNCANATPFYTLFVVFPSHCLCHEVTKTGRVGSLYSVWKRLTDFEVIPLNVGILHFRVDEGSRRVASGYVVFKYCWLFDIRMVVEHRGCFSRFCRLSIKTVSKKPKRWYISHRTYKQKLIFIDV